MLVKASFHFTPDERKWLHGAIEHGLQEIKALPFTGRGFVHEVLGAAHRRLLTSRDPWEGKGVEWNGRLVRELLRVFETLEGEGVLVDPAAVALLRRASTLAKKVELLGDEWDDGTGADSD